MCGHSTCLEAAGLTVAQFSRILCGGSFSDTATAANTPTTSTAAATAAVCRCCLLQVSGLREVLSCTEEDRELQQLAREELQQVEQQVRAGFCWCVRGLLQSGRKVRGSGGLGRFSKAGAGARGELQRAELQVRVLFLLHEGLLTASKHDTRELEPGGGGKGRGRGRGANMRTAAAGGAAGGVGLLDEEC